ncbi:MAG: YceI family protein, partial [Pseudomonadota bacterium]|nr:YceI family protein [Pseudomonadota bacterium]
ICRMEKVSMAKSMFPKLVILLNALGVMAPAQADWTLSESSRIGFVSIKNNSIGENNAFERVSGSISQSGQVSISVDLSSVETGVGIRNERLQKMLFEVLSFPTATIDAALTDKQIAALEAGGAQTESVGVSISLHGKTVNKAAKLSVSASGGDVRVTTTQPIVITAQEFGLEAGVSALQQIAGLNAISRSIPVTVDLRLIAD